MKRNAIVLACILAILGISVGHAGALRGDAATSERAGQAHTVTLSVFDYTALSSIPFGKKLVAQWEHMHPGVTVKLLPLPPGDPVAYQESILAAGTAPDIMVTAYGQQVFPDVPKGWWVDLTPYLNQPNPYAKSSKRWSDGFVQSTLMPTAFAGSKYYVLSWTGQDAAFFYNKDLFAKAGITHTPTTWAELMADATRIQKAGYTPEQFYLGDTYALGETGTVMSLLESQIMSKTLQRIDLNHDGSIDIGELVYGIKHHIFSPMNADYQEAWKLLKQWSQIWQPNAAGNKGYVNASSVVADQLFYQGKAAMVYRGMISWTQYAQANSNPSLNLKLKFHWGLFKFPQITPATTSFATPGVKPVGLWGSWNGYPWGITQTAQKDGHLKLAIDFLQWISAPQNAVPGGVQEGLAPVVKGYDPPMGTTIGDQVDQLTYDLLTHPNPLAATEVSLGPQWEKQRIATEQNYVLGVETLSQAMADMQRYTDQAADNAIKLYHLSVR